MRCVVSFVIGMVIWKVVIGPAVADAVKALETAAPRHATLFALAEGVALDP